MFSLNRFALHFYKDSWNFSFWYLYTFLAFLISLPLLRKFVKNLETIHYLYIISLAVIFVGIRPIIEYRIWNGNITLNGSLRVSWLTGAIVLYPCIGYFLEYKLDIEQIGKKLSLLWVINLLFIGISCYMTYYKIMVTGKCSESESQQFHSSFELINCITIYVTIKHLFVKNVLSQKIENIILLVGNSTFGIYLLHGALLDFPILWELFQIKWKINYMLSAFLFCFVVFSVGHFITLILKRIPILSKLI